MNCLRSRRRQLVPNHRHHPHPILHVQRPSNKRCGHSTRVASRTHRTEVKDNLRIDHPGVFATFFGKIPKLAEITTAVLQSCKEAEPPLFQVDVGWVNWPADCEEASVLQFLRRHIDRFLLLADEGGFCPSKRRRCITTPNKPIPGSVSKRKLDVGLAYNSGHGLEESEGQSYDWSHILVPGELKSNPREDNHSSTWLDPV